MLSTIRRDSRSASRRAASALRRSAISLFSASLAAVSSLVRCATCSSRSLAGSKDASTSDRAAHAWFRPALLKSCDEHDELFLRPSAVEMHTRHRVDGYHGTDDTMVQ